jgi:hypothetical protein
MAGSLAISNKFFDCKFEMLEELTPQLLTSRSGGGCHGPLIISAI